MPQDNITRTEGPQNIPGDDLSHDERVATLERGHYLIIDGRIIAHRQALDRVENKSQVPPQTALPVEKTEKAGAPKTDVVVNDGVVTRNDASNNAKDDEAAGK